jgi:hypothetical protein
MNERIETVLEFGMVLVEKQHKYFQDGFTDNSEHVSALKLIADAAYAYLKQRGITLDEAKKIKRALIIHGKSLFVEEWMKTEEGEEPLDEEDLQEAKETFDELLKESSA